jgi:hypothetical protein
MSAGIAQEDRRLAVFDERPFFERALVYGYRQGIIDDERLQQIRNDAPKGMVQIAEFFGTQYLRANIEEARLRIVNLVSLFLEETSGGDLARAARSLRDNTFLSHSRGGSEMLKRLWAMPEDSSHGLLTQQSQKEFLAVWSLRTLAAYRELFSPAPEQSSHDFGGSLVCRAVRRQTGGDFDGRCRVGHPQRTARSPDRKQVQVDAWRRRVCRHARQAEKEGPTRPPRGSA